MNVKTLALTVIENVVKVVILIFLITYILKGITTAYEFGYKVFADEPVSANNGKIITVAVSEGASVEEVAAMLEDKGLIEDQRLFVIQEYLSSYHDEIKPGIYDLSTGMTASEMIEILATENTIDDGMIEESSEPGSSEEFSEDGYEENPDSEEVITEEQISE